MCIFAIQSVVCGLSGDPSIWILERKLIIIIFNLYLIAQMHEYLSIHAAPDVHSVDLIPHYCNTNQALMKATITVVSLIMIIIILLTMHLTHPN